MSITEKDFNGLSNEVYLVDEKHDKYNPDIKAGEKIKIGKNEYEILKVEDNTTNGMQAMAVAPIVNGKVDTSQVVIAYAGTNFSDNLDKLADTSTVIGGNKDAMSIPGWWGVKTVDSQALTAQQFAAEIKKKYPSADITTTGHSLGQFLALYVAAENQWSNIGFNGPDPYKILSEDAKKWLKDNSGRLTNYRNKGDMIGNFGGNGTGAEVLIDMAMGNNPLDCHQLSAWKFDESGNLIISDLETNKEAQRIIAEKRMYARIIGLTLIKDKLLSSGGGLSANEAIFLDDSQALAAVESASEAMKAGLSSVLKIYQDAITEAEKVWQDGLSKARSIGTDLSENEIEAALAAGGATKADIVDSPTAFYEEKINKAKQLGESFDSLAKDIKAGIDKLVQSDKELASQIG